jgi:predicted AAA+ superfamily ATPase
MARTRSKNPSPKIPSDTEILRILHSNNPWWTGRPIPAAKIKAFKRRDYYKLEKQLEHDKISALIGARQVGKTTLMYQLIQKILSQRPPQNVLLVQVDGIYPQITIDSLEKIFNVYAANIIKTSLGELNDTIYILLDEIQSLQGWQNALKKWYDLGYKIKFIISGSSSIDIIDGMSESLVGRIKYQVVLPMKFVEFVRFKEQNSIGTLVDSFVIRLRQSLKESVVKNDPSIFFEILQAISNESVAQQDKLHVHLQQYLIKGGYPENAGIDDLIVCGENLREYLQLTLYKDIMKTGKVRDPSSLENLFSMISKESSGQMNRVNMASTLGIERPTLGTYIYLLKMAFLISESEFYSKSAATKARREKKLYVNDAGIRNVSSAVFDEDVLKDSTEMGKIVETVVADHTKRLKFNMESGAVPNTFYWHDGYEVDLVIDLFQKSLPIEVKYRENMSMSDLGGLIKFNKKFNPPLCIAVTKNQLERHDNTIFVPLWLYLVMC